MPIGLGLRLGFKPYQLLQERGATHCDNDYSARGTEVSWRRFILPKATSVFAKSPVIPRSCNMHNTVMLSWANGLNRSMIDVRLTPIGDLRQTTQTCWLVRPAPDIFDSGDQANVLLPSYCRRLRTYGTSSVLFISVAIRVPVRLIIIGRLLLRGWRGRSKKNLA